MKTKLCRIEGVQRPLSDFAKGPNGSYAANCSRHVRPEEKRTRKPPMSAPDIDLEATLAVAVICRDLPSRAARRILACVNACAGLSTEALEAGALGELVNDTRDFISDASNGLGPHVVRLSNALDKLEGK